MNFVISLPISANSKGDSYNSILVIVDRLTKMIHYKLVKVRIDALDLAKEIIDVIEGYQKVLESIIMD